jgi:hypothetical protein
MKSLLVVPLLAFACSIVMAQSADQPGPLLESQEFVRMKSEYRDCVLQKGSELLSVTSFETALRYAPLVCRRGLLQIKRFMLGSAFKVEVADGLLSSVAEGVEIDLANALLQEKLNEGEANAR